MKHQKTIYLLFILLTAFSVNAVDGVIEINQTCATQLGCFSGDSVGYPVRIDGSGGRSYRLTSDLILPSVSSTGIIMGTSNITLDLNGFSIIRAGCESSCTATVNAGFGIGITHSHFSYQNITVKNGSIIGMGSSGIDLGFYSIIESVTASYNGGNGIEVGLNSLITNNRTNYNLLTGIKADNYSTITKNKSFRNGLIGINASSHCMVDRNTATDNGTDGINAHFASLITNNIITSNDGIQLNLGSIMAAYSYNMIQGVNSVSGGKDIGHNYCNTNTTCP